MQSEDFPWAAERHAELQLAYQALLVKLAEYYLKQGMAPLVIRHMQKVLLDNPLYEKFHELLLQAYAVTGDRSALIQHYVQLEQIYGEELNLEPSGSIKALYAALRAGLERR